MNDSTNERAVDDGGNVGDAERMLSTIGGGALLVYGISRRSWGGTALALAGGVLAYRGLSGQPTGTIARRIGGNGVELRRSVTINREPEELYGFWRDFSNLPHFMKSVEVVRPISDTITHWVAKAPLGTTVEWNAEIINDHPNELIAWRSLENSEVMHAGLVRFRGTDRGTEVQLRMNYRAPLGGLGAALAKLLGDDPSKRIEEDLRRFKQIMEAGEIPTTEGQPTGGR
jgi:uncharacterized membrane protein